MLSRAVVLSLACAMLIGAAKQSATPVPAPAQWEVTQIWLNSRSEWRSTTVKGTGKLARVVRKGRENCVVHSYHKFCGRTPEYTEIRQLNYVPPVGQSCKWTRITADIDFGHVREQVSAYGIGRAAALKNLKNICGRALGDSHCTDPKRARIFETPQCGGIVHVDLRFALGWRKGHKTRRCKREGFTSVQTYRGAPYRYGGACFIGPRGRGIPSYL